MPIESASYVSALNAANPTIADPVAEWDDHMRLVKQVLVSTFPSIAGAVTATHTDLNTIPGVAARVTAVEANRARKDVGNTFTGSQVVNGTMNATVIQQSGANLVPAGSIIAWYGSIAAIPAGWLLCDGTNGTPNLSGKYIVGAGALAVGATVGVDTQTATSTSNGSHNHGAGTGAGGGHTHSGVASINGAHDHGAVTGGHVLTVGELPPHDHTLTLTGRSGNGLSASPSPGWGTDATSDGPWVATTSSVGSSTAHTHPIVADGAHNHALAVDAIGDHNHTIATDGAHTHTSTFDNRPASMALVWIMKS